MIDILIIGLAIILTTGFLEWFITNRRKIRRFLISYRDEHKVVYVSYPDFAGLMHYVNGTQIPVLVCNRYYILFNTFELFRLTLRKNEHECPQTLP